MSGDVVRDGEQWEHCRTPVARRTRARGRLKYHRNIGSAPQDRTGREGGGREQRDGGETAVRRPLVKLTCNAAATAAAALCHDLRLTRVDLTGARPDGYCLQCTDHTPEVFIYRPSREEKDFFDNDDDDDYDEHN